MKNKDYIINESEYQLNKSKDEEKFVRFMNQVQEGKLKIKKKC